jgi:hypothetical protein
MHALSFPTGFRAAGAPLANRCFPPAACPLLQSELVGKSEKDAYALPAANLVMLRLSRDELGFRPLAVAGELQVGGVGWSGGGGVG